MKRLFSIFLFLVSWQMLMAQATTFSKVFGDVGVLSGGVNITSLNDSIYFSIYTQDTTSSYQYIDFIKTAPNGTEAARLKIKEQAYSFISGLTGSLKMTTDGYLVCAGSSGPSGGVGSGTFFKMDRTTLDSLYIKYYRNPREGADFFGFGELSDGNYLFAGHEGDSTSPQGYLSAWMVKTDTAGNELWQKSMTSDVYNGCAFVSPFQEGYYQYWATGNNVVASNGGISAIFIDKYDNGGNLQWEDTFGIFGHANDPGPITALKDGGVIVVINTLDTTGFLMGPRIIYKMDSNGALVWQHYISPYRYLNGLIETPSGNIVACGGGEGYPIGVNGDTTYRGRGMIMKFDKAGNMIFSQVYEYDTLNYDGLYDITETSDGGYACVGIAYPQNVQKAWLLKVDSNGCLNGDCPQIQTGIKDIPGLASFFVFPNPVSSQFTVALAGPNDLERYSDLHFMLYDLTGREVMNEALKQQTTILQRHDISAGMYVWQIADGNSILSNGKLVFK